MADIPEKTRTILSEPNIAYLATITKDGSPQVSPVWVDVDDNAILVNTAKGRARVANVQREPRVALSAAEHENVYSKVDIRGRVVEIVEGEEAERHIDKMAKKYIGQDEYPWRSPGEERLILRIEPTAVSEYP